ncbi:hypothetical protein C8J57DRAFT_1521561 [Mycena rebaudengoi]|nr:hypothetical protein C8J57DRAFT_1521561 [Mycena rebaudengoi]
MVFKLKLLKLRIAHDAVDELGENTLTEKSLPELIRYLQTFNAQKIAEAGGLAAWNALSAIEQAERDKKLMEEIVQTIGKEEYNALPTDDKRALDLFFWAGCCMHKDANSFEGGNTEMMKTYDDADIPAPILLANKANSVALKRLLEPGTRVPDTLTEDEQRAFENSTRGGAKLCAIAGAILNNKDDKKGQGDKHTDFMSFRTGKKHARFPDTSNTRFASHGLAAAELVKYLDEYRELMDIIEYSKAHPGLTNIEKNVRDALDDIPTITELCAMVLYQQAVQQPYIRVVRGPGTEATNALDLGPLHLEVRKHIEEILENPERITSTNISYLTAALDAQPWQDPAAIEAVVKLMPTLPHLKDVVLRFFRGSLTTWIRFSAEFAPGGLIDEASASERQLAWMPATNDANESSLVQYRVKMRGSATLTLHQFNALVMYQQNNTQDFMDALFEPPDYLYVMRLARKEDASGLERQRKAELAEFQIRFATLKKTKALAKHQKDMDDLHVLVKLPLVSSVAQIYDTTQGRNLTVAKLNQQLNAFRMRGIPDLKVNSKYARKADKQAALEAALKKYQASPELFQIPDAILLKVSGSSRGPETHVVVDWVEEEDVEMED